MQDMPENAFKEEAYELLSELEDSLLELEDNPEDAELVGKVFRAMHTIKGSGAMFGFSSIAEFTHEVETVYDLVRNKKILVDKILIELSLKARDHILSLLNCQKEDEQQAVQNGLTLVSQFKALANSVVPSSEKINTHQESNSPHPKDQQSELITYRIRFKPNRDILHNGTNLSQLLDELAAMGTSRVIAHRSNLVALDELLPEDCYMSWDIILSTDQGEDAIRDVFIFVEDDCELTIRTVSTGGEDDNFEQKRLGDILIERGDISQEVIDTVLAKSKRIGEMLVEANLVSQSDIESALIEQQEVRKVVEKRKQERSDKTPAVSSLRVPVQRLDELVNLVGEMVTVQSRLSQTAALSGEVELQAIAEEVERLTEELRDTTLNIRMLPIGSTFNKFKRLVRDIASDLHKEVDFQTVGAETELDKTVIEQLNDPLVHIIRNSMDHGIEMPDVREAAGKPRAGTVYLSAEPAGDSVIIEIRDDGKGLNAEVLREKAISKGIISADDTLSDNECYQLIFAAGFSTAEKVSGLSGRGVGMDVVKRAIDGLRGTISLESNLGVGTTLKLRIPLTLAIIESLLVKIGNNSFVLPLSVVEECIELTRADIEEVHGRCLVNVRGHLIPYIPLRQTFAIEGELPAIQQVVIAQVNGQKLGFVVDNVIGEHQTVIKTLGPLYRDVNTVSGGTILGDGSIALIIDLMQLMKQAALEETSK